MPGLGLIMLLLLILAVLAAVHIGRLIDSNNPYESLQACRCVGVTLTLKAILGLPALAAVSTLENSGLLGGFPTVNASQQQLPAEGLALDTWRHTCASNYLTFISRTV